MRNKKEKEEQMDHAADVIILRHDRAAASLIEVTCWHTPQSGAIHRLTDAYLSTVPNL